MKDEEFRNVLIKNSGFFALDKRVFNQSILMNLSYLFVGQLIHHTSYNFFSNINLTYHLLILFQKEYFIFVFRLGNIPRFIVLLSHHFIQFQIVVFLSQQIQNKQFINLDECAREMKRFDLNETSKKCIRSKMNSCIDRFVNELRKRRITTK